MPLTVSDLRAALQHYRRALLAALQELTERDFETAIDGATVGERLAALAPAEREAVRRARAAAAAAPRPQPAATRRERVLPPQIVHDLAGARFETLLLLDALAEAQLDAAADGERVRDLLAGIAAREWAVAERLAALQPAGGGPGSGNPRAGA